jgi:ornithine decarboxylase
MVCRVIGTAQRGGQAWMYLDTGLFGGFMETYAGLRYPMRTDKAGSSIPWVIAGPTCDTKDVIVPDAMLPQDMGVGAASMWAVPVLTPKPMPRSSMDFPCPP